LDFKSFVAIVGAGRDNAAFMAFLLLNDADFTNYASASHVGFGDELPSVSPYRLPVPL